MRLQKSSDADPTQGTGLKWNRDNRAAGRTSCFFQWIQFTLKLHEHQRIFRNTDEDYKHQYKLFQEKYLLTA